jgi:hypothetical protein
MALSAHAKTLLLEKRLTRRFGYLPLPVLENVCLCLECS